VAVLVPPLAPTVVQEMKKVGRYADFAAMVRSTLSGKDVAVIDISDATDLGANDCEFVDGSHGAMCCISGCLSVWLSSATRFSRTMSI